MAGRLVLATNIFEHHNYCPGLPFKFAVIQLTGWIFNAKEPATTYSFIVFLVNKIIGLVLLPLLLLLAFF